MEKILLFGATGNLGKEIARVAIHQGYELTAVVRNERKAAELKDITQRSVVCDITSTSALKNICNGFDVVVSALGKSVSPNDHSKPSFREIDLDANSNILEEAKKSRIKKFVYVSAFHAERYLHLEYFSVHHEFAQRLKTSGINYSIIKPPAIFSSFLDLAKMAKKGQLVNIGKGDKRTNPIHESDLATTCVNSIKDTNVTIEIGGKEVYTRRQINEIIQRSVNPKKTVKNIPLSLFKFSLPILKLFNKNMYDKFSFFTAVMQEDTIAPQIGERNLEEYIRSKNTR